MAGTDTTAHLMLLIVYYLALNPQIEQKLREQVAEVIKEDKDITVDNLKKLTYIDYLQKEGTRIYGPGTGIFFR